LKVRSMVGLIPLFAVETLEPEIIARLPGFQRRMQWFLDNMPGFASRVDCSQCSPNGVRRLLSLVDRKQLVRILGYMVDKEEFLSPHGIRALSKYHAAHPYILPVDGMEHRVDYEPGESQSGLFGGNSNWRGPVWFPMNFLMIESLQKFHHYYGDDFRVECPTGSGQQMSLWEVGAEISRSLTHIFLRDENGRRPLHGSIEKFQNDPNWRDLILFYEYFHGDTGAGLGASHQTGWTGLVSKLLEQTGE
jgi:glycosyl hydrolase family 63